MDINTLNTVLSMLASLLGIVSVALAVRWKKRIAGLRYMKLTLNLVNDPLDFFEAESASNAMSQKVRGLRVLLDGVECDRLSVTRIAVWNAGKEVIINEEIALADPLRVVPLGTVQIRRGSLLHVTDRGSGVKLKVRRAQCDFSFDYLEPGSGFILELLHTGRDSASLVVRGSIRGHGALTTEQSIDPSSAARLGFYFARRPRLARIAFGAFFLFVAYYLYESFDPLRFVSFASFLEAAQERYIGSSDRELRAIYLVESLLFAYLFVTGLSAGITIIFSQAPPRNLRLFETRWPWFHRGGDAL